jgi:hypothetical protein
MPIFNIEGKGFNMKDKMKCVILLYIGGVMIAPE